MDKNGKTITEEIELTIQIIENPLDIAKSNLPLYNKNFSPLDLDFGVNITCYYKKAICYLKTDKSIGISKVLNNNNQIEFYNYNAFKNKLEPIKLKPLACELNSETLKNYNFKSSVSSNKNEYPELSFQVKTSKVHISLKKNLKKNTLNFDITPVYGYKENFFQLYGDRIKGYPELKNYEEIRWDYVGENLEDDLKKIYFLSEQAKTEKLERSSTFYFYVLDIKDIFLIPHPNKDSYVLNIVQGLDTIKLEVLPYIKTVHLKKIQKWHEKKFEKYSSELLERKKYWIKLDSLYLNQYEDLEEKLNDFKTFVVNTEDHKIWNGNDGEEIKSDGTLFEINKTGLYLITQPLSINDFSIHNFQFEILGHKHFPKYVLIHNAISNHTYWQESNNVRIEKKGLSSIYSLVGDVLYYGIFENKDLIQLNKFKK